jgi:outer membrane lipopolysaccharide assembly protein LptE/RlpB
MPAFRIRTALLAALLVLLTACAHGPSLQQQVMQRLSTLSRSAELGTVEYTVRKAVRARDEGEWFKIGNRRILFSCTAYIKAGINLKNLSLDKIVVDESTRSVSLVLPHATVLSLNLPPEEIRLEYEDVTGFRQKFSDQERQALLKQGERDILRDIPSMGILAEAEENALEFFRPMLEQMGFENVQISFE